MGRVFAGGFLVDVCQMVRGVGLLWAIFASGDVRFFSVDYGGRLSDYIISECFGAEQVYGR